MLPPLTASDVLAILNQRLDAGWLGALQSTPDGVALLGALQDLAIAVDTLDAARASSLFARPASTQIAPSAGGASQATTTLSVTRTRPGAPVALPAGSRAQTPDGHVYLTGAPLAFGGGQVGVPQVTTGTAVAVGEPGVIPVGEVTQWAPVASGITGAGKSIALVTLAGSVKALKFTTDLTQPSPFRDAHVGQYLQITSADPAGAANVGRIVSIALVNDGFFFADPQLPDGNAAAWAPSIDTSIDASYSVWTLGTFNYTWQVLDWSDLGFSVTNTTPVVGGTEGVLDELAKARGRPRLVGEADAALVARLGAPPEPPSPLGALRKLTATLVPYGMGRLDLQIYELGQGPPAAIDPYAVNFPAAAGFVSDFHATDMPSPLTPALMAPQGPPGAMGPTTGLLATWANPGLALVVAGDRPWDVVVRWDPPGGMPGATVAALRALLTMALESAEQPGCIAQLYNTLSWSFPT